MNKNNDIEMLSKELVALNEQLASIKILLDETKEQFEKKMDELNMNVYKGNGVYVLKTKESQREKFDSKKFKEKNPLLYDQYCSTVNVAGGFRYKFEK